VILPSDLTVQQSFTIELAPLDYVPHSVHVFLEQVSHGLWNNAFFYVNGPHVLQCGPHALNTQVQTASAAALKPFQDLQLDTLAFPEYSDKFPHVPWTLGFTGRPGGPDWYINKQDNTYGHGPGGQTQHELGDYGDPCFAKVVSGFDTLQNTFREKTFQTGEMQFFYEEPVRIVKSEIVGWVKPVNVNKGAGDAAEATIQAAANNAELAGNAGFMAGAGIAAAVTAAAEQMINRERLDTLNEQHAAGAHFPGNVRQTIQHGKVPPPPERILQEQAQNGHQILQQNVESAQQNLQHNVHNGQQNVGNAQQNIHQNTVPATIDQHPRRIVLQGDIPLPSDPNAQHNVQANVVPPPISQHGQSNSQQNVGANAQQQAPNDGLPRPGSGQAIDSGANSHSYQNNYDPLHEQLEIIPENVQLQAAHATGVNSIAEQINREVKGAHDSVHTNLGYRENVDNKGGHATTNIENDKKKKLMMAKF
jgi:hypothetical protein